MNKDSAHRSTAPAPTWVIFKKEGLDILRDRRAIFFAFVLPVILYPVLFFSFSVISGERERFSTLEVGILGDGAFLPYLNEAGLVGEEREFTQEAVRGGRPSLFLRFGRPEEQSVGGEGFPETGPLKKITMYHVATSPRSEEARRRIRVAIERYRQDLLKQRFAKEEVPLDPLSLIHVTPIDVSSPEDRSGSNLGRVLPLLLVVLLLTGGSFAAIDLVAGEKERGTLETLYIHPVPQASIVWGKLLILFLTSLVSLLFNFAGMLVSLSLGAGLGMLTETSFGALILLPPVSTLLVIFLLTLPLCILTSAILLAISSYARSFREAQTYLLPVTLLALVLVLFAFSPQAKLASAVAVVPIANVALAVREALEGNLEILPFLIALSSSSLYAWAALLKASSLLKREDVVLNLEPSPLAGDARGEGRARRGLLFGFVMLVFLYFSASWAQSKSPYWGLAVTLWVLILIPSLLYPKLVKAPFRDALGLRSTPFRNYLLSLPIACSAVVLVSAYQSFQNKFLPLPPEIEEELKKLFALERLSFLPGILLFAVSPGICEELLWRGAFQGELEPRKQTLRTVLTVGIFFGFFHLDVYRLVPTALLGTVLALVRHRSGSIFPCMLVHTAYNASLYVLSLFGPFSSDREALGLFGEPLVIVGSALVLGGAFLGLCQAKGAPLACSQDDSLSRSQAGE